MLEENNKQTNRLIAHLEKVHRMQKIDDIQSKKRALEEAVQGENLNLSIQITPCSDTVDISDITTPSKSSPIESVVEITGEAIEDTTDINAVTTKISQSVLSSQSLKGIGCVEGIVKEWDSSFRHMIQMSETTSKSKLENIKIKNYQKVQRLLLGCNYKSPLYDEDKKRSVAPESIAPVVGNLSIVGVRHIGFCKVVSFL